MMNRENLSIPPSMAGYVDRVKEKDPVKAISRNTKAFRKLLKKIPGKKAGYAYAPGKWTLREMLQHIIDAERVFAFRALHIARKDISPLPGFDENAWADNSKASARKWNDLLDEFFMLREANEKLFANLDQQQFLQTGIANNSQVSVATLAFVSAGHVDHHMHIILTRYLQPWPAAPGKKDYKTKKKEVRKKTGTEKKAGRKSPDKSASIQTGELKKDIGFATPGNTRPEKKKTVTADKKEKNKSAKSAKKK